MEFKPSEVYTIVPDRSSVFNRNMFDDIAKIPKIGELTAFGLDEVNFPVFAADPKMFIPDNFVSMTVKEAMKEMSNHVYQWLEVGDKKPAAMLSKNFDSLPLDERAKEIAAFMAKYQKSPATPAYLNNAILKTLKKPDEDMSERHFRVALISYAGHFAGEELEDVFRDTMTYNTDMGNTTGVFVEAEMNWAGNNFKRQDKALQNILEHQHDGTKELHEQVAELADGLCDLGLDNPQLAVFAHKATDSKYRLSNNENGIKEEIKNEIKTTPEMRY